MGQKSIVIFQTMILCIINHEYYIPVGEPHRNNPCVKIKLNSSYFDIKILENATGKVRANNSSCSL